MPKVPNFNKEEATQEDSEKETFGSDFKFYKSSLVPGLGVRIGDEPNRDGVPQKVRFVPYSFYDEEKGETIRVGYLATEEQDAHEVLSDDANVEEIDEKEYRDALDKGTRAKY